MQVLMLIRKNIVCLFRLDWYASTGANSTPQRWTKTLSHRSIIDPVADRFHHRTFFLERLDLLCAIIQNRELEPVRGRVPQFPRQIVSAL